VRVPILLATLSLAALAAACSASSPAPKGWRAMPGESDAWSSGTGANLSEYFYEKKPYGGSLSDLASRVTIDALMRHPGAKLQGSVPFAPCPGAAGVATVRLRDDMTMQEGFAVRDGQAIRTTYVRPTGTPVAPAVTEAMKSSLCTL